VEGVSLMTTPFDPEIRAKLAKVFNVSETDCDQYNEFYDRIILPCIQEKYLAHMITAAEEMIDEEIRKKELINEEGKKDAEVQAKQEVEIPKIRRYTIVLSKRKPPKYRKSYTWSLVSGAIITYEPNNDKRDLRIFVAHEIGHLLIEYGILSGTNTENYANLFAFFAISGKNDFYNNRVPGIIYKGGDLEILNRINTVCHDSK